MLRAATVRWARTERLRHSPAVRLRQGHLSVHAVPPDRATSPLGRPDGTAPGCAGTAGRQALLWMRAIASARVVGLVSIIPRTAEVIVRAPPFLTPRMVMQRCSASM